MRVPAIVFVLAAAAFAAVPFWEAKPPAEWTDDQLQQFLIDSPWAEQAFSAKQTTGALVFLCDAHPMREAEAERERRANLKHPPKPVEDPTAEEFADFLKENEGNYIVLAVPAPNPKVFEDAAEVKRIEEECVLKVGKKKYKMTGHFPPSPSDAWLRLVFPRVVTEADKSFRFELYIPWITDPYRFAEFQVKDLMYKGRLEL
jgi:hypothetical protein